MTNGLIVREYLGNNIIFKMINGEVYADATSMAKAFEKGSQKLADWKRSAKTKELVTELNKINDMENSHNAKELIISEKGGADGGGSTWIEENLLLDFAQYLNVKFRVWCNKQITTLIRDGEVSIKKLDSYAIENPIERAKRWIEEQEQKILLENKIAEDEPFVEVAKNRIEQMGSLSLTDVTKSLGLKKGRITRWAKEQGFLHKTKLEVNIAGEEYFTVYVSNGFKTIGINEAGLKLINANLESIR